MKTRKLGQSSLQIAGPLAFGGNVFGWTLDQAASFQLLDAFVARGFNFIDTADIYSKWASGNKGGESETIIGNWTKARSNREKILIATKVGMEMGPADKGLSRAYIRRAIDKSLQRLQTDYIDLYQSHADDLETPLEETLGAFAELVSEGKVRAIGASNFTAQRLADSLRVSRSSSFPGYESLQPHYNLYQRAKYESELEPLCRKENIGVIPYFSLAKGFLTGKYRSEADLSKSVRGGGVKEYLNDRGFRILDALDTVSSQLSSTPAAVSLAWLIARPGITAPIASATTLQQLDQLVAATQLNLDPSSIELLNRASS